VNRRGPARHRAGWLGALAIMLVYGGLALLVDVPARAGDIWSDEATYWLMGHSLVADGDLEYRREDLDRAFAEFPAGPSGIFLKRGVDVTGVSLVAEAPYVVFGPPDPDPDRLYFGKAFIHPLAAAPFVAVFGTNGFLLLNALLLAAAFLAAYLFLSARAPVAPSLVMASAFVFATIVPVYFVWVQPELFNFTVGLLAYFFWLYKYVAPTAGSPRTAWLRGPASDVLAAVLVGVVTFSKPTHGLLMAPIGLWLLGQGQWRRLAAVCATWTLVTAGLFGANVAVSGEWNYQGGDRSTCYGTYPFQRDGAALEICDERGRNEALATVLFDAEVFWSNLRANVAYFFVGRNSGLVAYFFPAVFGMVALLVAGRRREPWQWLVLFGVVAQILVLIVLLPYTYFGGGGSVGNRYFMGVYGICLFLLPPIRSLWLAAVPLVVGAAFMAPLVLQPFHTSRFPASHAKGAPFDRLPVELTNVLDLPLNNELARVRQPFGNHPGVGDHPFQLFFLDDDAYGKESETDARFWLRGRSAAQFLVRTDRPVSRLQLELRAGAADTEITARVGDREVTVPVAADRRAAIVISLPPGFPNKHARPVESPGPSYIWMLTLESSAGFVPADLEPGSTDTRLLGILVRPMVFP
jgi:hypothetical protein